MQIALRERKRPLRFCNRYASAIAPSDPEAGENIVAAGAASDALTALTELDDFKQRRLHVTEFAARVKLRRGLRQAFIRSVDDAAAGAPRAARPRARSTCRSSAARASRAPSGCGSRTRSAPGPAAARVHRPRRRRPRLRPVRRAAWRRSRSAATRRTTAPGDPGARSIEAVAAARPRRRALRRRDGCALGGRRVRAYRDADLRISGRGAADRARPPLEEYGRRACHRSGSTAVPTRSSSSTRTRAGRSRRRSSEQGIEYEVVKGPLRRGKRDELEALSGQRIYPVIEFPDGDGLPRRIQGDGRPDRRGQADARGPLTTAADLPNGRNPRARRPFPHRTRIPPERTGARRRGRTTRRPLLNPKGVAMKARALAAFAAGLLLAVPASAQRGRLQRPARFLEFPRRPATAHRRHLLDEP